MTNMTQYFLLAKKIKIWAFLSKILYYNLYKINCFFFWLNKTLLHFYQAFNAELISKPISSLNLNAIFSSTFGNSFCLLLNTQQWKIEIQKKFMLKLMNHNISNVGYPHNFTPGKIYWKKCWEKIKIEIINWAKLSNRSTDTNNARYRDSLILKQIY